jgi:NAD(P)-dependent dehydrogenase (short-subunit alcohol dehydrogenase family)
VATGLREWRRVLEVNLAGPFLACKIIGETMLDQGDGRIVNVCSIAAHVGLEESAAYGFFLTARFVTGVDLPVDGGFLAGGI